MEEALKPVVGALDVVIDEIERSSLLRHGSGCRELVAWVVVVMLVSLPLSSLSRAVALSIWDLSWATSCSIECSSSLEGIWPPFSGEGEIPRWGLEENVVSIDIICLVCRSSSATPHFCGRDSLDRRTQLFVIKHPSIGLLVRPPIEHVRAMGKTKKGFQKNTKLASDRRKTSGKPRPALPKSKKAKSKAIKPQQQQQQQQHKIIIPFGPEHRVLLVGEGDFSFSRSLLEHHGIIHIYATSLDTRSGVLAKYPQAANHLRVVEAQDSSQVEYSVDATKLGRAGGGGGGKEVRKGGWDRIVFNFPHVGGLTKDVNRQVRANQGR